MRSVIYWIFVVFSLAVSAEYAICADHEGDQYVKAWLNYDKHKYDESLEILNKYNKPSSPFSEGWMVLHASILIRKGLYREALDIVDAVRSRLEQAYLIISTNPTATNEITKEERESIRFLYYRMIYVSAMAKFNLSNCTNAIDDFKIMETIKEYREESADVSVYYFFSDLSLSDQKISKLFGIF